jgi:hypothetical protein
MEVRKCLWCGKLFIPNSEAHHYCTPKCFDKAYEDDDPYTPRAKNRLIGENTKEG